MDKELIKAMDDLLAKYTDLDSKSKMTTKTLIAKAVSLGMNYQEKKIKEGIKIVFENLNK